MTGRHERLKARLDDLCRAYGSACLDSDPLRYLHRYKAPEDIETVGLVVSCLAYGRVGQIFKSVEALLGLMGDSPARYIARFDPASDGARLANFRHRFNGGEDMACLFRFMRQTAERYGSMGGLVRSLYDDGERDTGRLIARLSAHMLSLDYTPVYDGPALPDKAGVRYFFPSPLGGSACKRLCLYLRWMVRKEDGLDLGLWDFIPPSKLVIPLDTHIARLSQMLGLTTMKSPGWKMAVEITESLKRLDPDDPLRYDFALTRLGILDLCPKRMDKEKCADCGIADLCALNPA